MARRGPMEVAAMSWEFPGGKVEDGESHIQALQREILEELSIEVCVGDFFMEHHFSAGGREFKMYTYWVDYSEIDRLEENIKLIDHDCWMWVDPYKMNLLQLSKGDIEIVEKLIQDHGRNKRG